MNVARNLLGGILAAVALLLAAPAAADDALKPGTTVRSVLNDALGKKVGLRLASHEEIEGTVAAVGDQLVKMTRLSGRDYFDAYVVIDHVSAVIVRSR